MTTILFWDIDGTLLNSKGAGRLALQEVTRELTGNPVDLSHIRMAGMTDWGIASQILEHLEISPSPQAIEELLGLYQHYIHASLAQTQGFVLAGVRDILETLEKREDVLCLLLTGNIEAGARAKLAHYGLEKYFQGGGFGEGTVDRCAVARKALAVAQAQVERVHLDRCYVLGDTPHDIRCGQAIGARTIGIASGHYSVADLSACESWLVWEEFPAVATFMAQVGLTTDCTA
jgi:phosphoglycolate phosphatase